MEKPAPPTGVADPGCNRRVGLPDGGNRGASQALQSTMKKFLLFGGFGLLVVLAVVYVGVTFFFGSIVKSTVNRVGPKVTQSRVELSSATISPLAGTGTLSGFTVGNPAAWSAGDALSLGTMHLDMEPKSIFSDVIVVNELVIDEPVFNYESRLLTSNIGDLLANIKKYGGEGDKEAAKDGPPKKFIVKKLRFTNGKATLGVGFGAAAVPVPLPEIRLDDVGVAEGGVTGSQLAVTVLGDVLKTVAETVAKSPGHAGADTLEKAKEAAKQVTDSVKGLFKEKKP